MMKKWLSGILVLIAAMANSQNPLPNFTEMDLWKLGYANGLSASADGKYLVFSVRTYDLDKNKGQNDLFVYQVQTKKVTPITQTPESENGACFYGKTQKIVFSCASAEGNQIFSINPDGTQRTQLSSIDGGISEFKFSSDGKRLAYTQEVKLDQKVSEKYSDLPKTTAMVYDGLMFKHWNQWADDQYSHLFYLDIQGDRFVGRGTDVMENERWDFPMLPHDGIDQMDLSPDGNLLAYATKKSFGTDAARSTNSEVYVFNITSGNTAVFTRGNDGYDKEPRFSPDGKSLVWLSMERNGFEADLSRLMIQGIDEQGNPFGKPQNLTGTFEYNSHHPLFFSNSKIGVTVEIEGTIQVYTSEKKTDWSALKPATKGFHNYNDFTVAGSLVFGLKSTLLAPNELYLIDGLKMTETKVSAINDATLKNFATPTMELVKVPSSDGKEIFTWVVKPANFNPNQKYPALLLCQGGPQSMVGQGFSTRWNTRVMAGHGYVVMYPNRRGLPGFGKEWNESISGKWGEQAMQDLLSVTDHFAKQSYINNEKLGAVGASFGGYSVYWLAGNHQNRFKAFIAHCGIFNTESMYGSTEEIFFSDWDSDGPFWKTPKPKTYTEYSPHLYVQNWNTPILVIHNEKDFRVPLEQGQMAFTSAQLRGVPSRLLVFPDEGHWVLKPQNSVAWNREFFNWLDTYLK